MAARNLCPCGRTGIEGQECRCSAREKTLYTLRLSEPLLDRFELFCEVPFISSEEWERKVEGIGEKFAQIINRVRGSREKVIWSTSASEALSQAIERLHLSGRAREAVVSVASTIAQIEEKKVVGKEEVTEALQYRRRGD